MRFSEETYCTYHPGAAHIKDTDHGKEADKF